MFSPSNQMINDISKDINIDPLSKPLAQSISDISWITNQQSNIFATSQWGGDFRIYQIAQQNNLACLATKMHLETQSPITSCCWTNDNSAVILGFANNSLKAVDVNSQQVTDLGTNPNGIGVHFIAPVPNSNVFMTASYGDSILFWQPNAGNQPIQMINTGEKILCCDYQNGTFVGACQGQKLVFYQSNNFQQKTLIQNLDLGKYSQLNSVKLHPNGKIVGMGSIDGRVNISRILQGNKQITLKTNITFKANKNEEGSNTILYPVNTVDFNIKSEPWILTGGSDGQSSLWDYSQKNKIRNFNFGGNPFCKGRVSPKGDFFAYGLGNDWHIGQQGQGKWNPMLAVHFIPDNQLQYSSVKH